MALQTTRGSKAMKDLALTRHTVRCPLEDRPASLTVRTDLEASPASRHREVVSCSLLPCASFVPPARKAFFADMPPSVSYLCEVDSTPIHASERACSRRCLAVLNAAERGAAETLRCTSGFADSVELVRQTQSPAVVRLLWTYGA
jgi:hypothetical protein